MSDNFVVIGEDAIRGACDAVWGEQLNTPAMSKFPDELVGQLAGKEKSPEGVSTSYAIAAANYFDNGSPLFHVVMHQGDRFVDNLGLEKEFADEVKKDFRSSSNPEIKNL